MALYYDLGEQETDSQKISRLVDEKKALTKANEQLTEQLLIHSVVVSETELCDNFKPYFGIGKMGWEVTHCANCGKKHKHN